MTSSGVTVLSAGEAVFPTLSHMTCSKARCTFFTGEPALDIVG